MERTVAERLWQKVDPQDQNGCLIWTGSDTDRGYGKIHVDGRDERVHRVSYELANGPIPGDLVVDHVWERGCRSTLCVNPSHLEAVTQNENVQRGERRRRTHCVNDHEFTERNTYWCPRGWRQCRTCHRARQRDRKR